MAGFLLCFPLLLDFFCLFPMFTVSQSFYHDSLMNPLHQGFSDIPYQVHQGHPSCSSAHLSSTSNSPFLNIPLLFEPPAAFDTADPSFPSQYLLPVFFLCHWSRFRILDWLLLKEVAWADTSTFHLYCFSASIWLCNLFLPQQPGRSFKTFS